MRYDLKLDGLALELDSANLEIDADGRYEGLGVGVVSKAEQQTRLADARIADQQQLEQVVANVVVVVERVSYEGALTIQVPLQGRLHLRLLLKRSTSSLSY